MCAGMEMDYSNSMVPTSNPYRPAAPIQHLNNVQVKLLNRDLWQQFREIGTEMIITKFGRRMFPSIRLAVEGLEPDALYFILMDVALASEHRYRFVEPAWVFAGSSEPGQLTPPTPYVHPDSPAAGSFWMSQPVCLQRVKISNNPQDRNNNIILASMHKYLPRIHVVLASDVLAIHNSPSAMFSFPETEFFAVTAYQNKKITQLKIDNNPFAKGFRRNGSSCKLKRLQQAHQDETGATLVRKRTCSEQSSTSSTNDSGCFSHTSSPAMEEPSSFYDPIMPNDRLLGPGNQLTPIIPPFPWQGLPPPTPSYFPLAYSLLYNNSHLWKFPYLLPPPLPPLIPYSYIPLRFQPPDPVAPTIQESLLMDLSLKPKNYSVKDNSC